MAEYIQKGSKVDASPNRNKSILQDTVNIDDNQLMENETVNLQSAKTNPIVENCELKLQEKNAFFQTYIPKKLIWKI